MGLEQVIADVRRDGEQRAQAVLDGARAEAKQILDAAEAKVQEYASQRQEQAQKDAAALRQQVESGAGFEARKAVLHAENELREELRDTILDGLRGLSGSARAKHLDALVARAKETIPDGKVWANAQDESALADSGYAFEGALGIAGGIIVESDDGEVRLDLSYETLLHDAWRDILRAESALFA